MHRYPIVVALAACLWSTPGSAAPAPCDAPSSPPIEVSSTAAPDGTRIDVVIGTWSTCDVALREFRVALPTARAVHRVAAQLSLAGFTRRYGLHQIGFTLRKVDAVPDAQGVDIRFTATLEGLDSVQIAYTLYVTSGP